MVQRVGAGHCPEDLLSEEEQEKYNKEIDTAPTLIEKIEIYASYQHRKIKKRVPAADMFYSEGNKLDISNESPIYHSH